MFRHHFSQTSRIFVYRIPEVRSIPQSMSLSVTKTIGAAHSSSIIDYCNSYVCNVAFDDVVKRISGCLAILCTGTQG